MNILIIAAHPDDEILGCGGLISKYVREGHSVYVHIVTDGSSSQYEGNNEIAKQKENEITEVMKMIGVKEFFRGNLPDMKLDSISHIEVNKELGRIIDKVLPDIVFTHHKGDVNKDHKIIYESTLVMARPLLGNTIKELYSYETLSSSEWGELEELFTPNTYIELNKNDIENKCKAMKLYKTEIREYPHPRSIEAIKNLSKYRGNQIEVKYAEAFKLIRKVDKI